MPPVLAASSGGRQWAVVLQRYTTPKFHKRHKWEEEKQSLLKSLQVAKNESEEGCCAVKVRREHVQSS